MPQPEPSPRRELPRELLDQIAVLVLTHNEQANIARTLAMLARFPAVLVLDSGSEDETMAIATSVPNVRIEVRQFDCHAAQWNHGISLLPKDLTWVLALDADYILTRDIVEEIAGLSPPSGVSGYRARMTYCIGGKPLRASLYPPTTILFRRTDGRYVQAGHTQRLMVSGQVLPLGGRVLHDDRKPLARWLAAQARYAALEADYILERSSAELRPIDRLRRLGWIAPLLVLPHTLIVKRCLLDGWRGLFYALQRLVAESMIALAVLERRFRASQGKTEPC